MGQSKYEATRIDLGSGDVCVMGVRDGLSQGVSLSNLHGNHEPGEGFKDLPGIPFLSILSTNQEGLDALISILTKVRDRLPRRGASSDDPPPSRWALIQPRGTFDWAKVDGADHEWGLVDSRTATEPQPPSEEYALASGSKPARTPKPSRSASPSPGPRPRKRRR